MKQGNKADTKPAHKNVGNKHCAIIKTRLGHKVLPAMLAFVFHIKRTLEGERWRFKHVRLVAFRTFKSTDTVGFATFPENAHRRFFFVFVVCNLLYMKKVSCFFAKKVPNESALHVALAVFEALDDEGHVALFERIEHAPAIAFDT